MIPFEHPLYVTEPSLPDLREFCSGLQNIWDRCRLTNNGPEVQAFAAHRWHPSASEAKSCLASSILSGYALPIFSCGVRKYLA